MTILPSTLLGILPVGCLLSMRGTLSAETFLSVIVLSFGVMQPLITAFSHTDDIAQAGLQYGKDQYDRERYAELRQIAAEMLSARTGLPTEKIHDLFCNETGYQTPKVDTRAAVFADGRILLVHENNGTWALPGGWYDVDHRVEHGKGSAGGSRIRGNGGTAHCRAGLADCQRGCRETAPFLTLNALLYTNLIVSAIKICAI